MEMQARHYRTWRILQRVARGPLQRIFCFTCEKAEPGIEPYLVVCNHNTDLDPALVALSFPDKQMYFVASEHVFRKGLPSKLLNYFFAPISRMKGSTDAAAALEILRTLRKGKNVCLFAEGNRSFNGVTGPVFPATGKLSKASGAALITYKLEGGYLTSPRWSKTLRKGRMLGYVVNVYPPEQLKTMTPEQINAAIAADLYEDAYERQAAEPVDYVGKRLAEGLENALYICPRCGKTGTLKSEGDRFFCTCGMEVQYTVRGTFAGAEVPFENVRDWDVWQTERMQEMAAQAGREPVLSDTGMSLQLVDEQHRSQTIATGMLTMSAEELRVGEQAFSLASINSMAQIGASTILFTAEGKHYELLSDAHYYCGRKYITLYQLLKK